MKSNAVIGNVVLFLVIISVQLRCSVNTSLNTQFNSFLKSKQNLPAIKDTDVIEYYDLIEEEKNCSPRCDICDGEKCLKCKNLNEIPFLNSCTNQCPKGYILNKKRKQCDEMVYVNYDIIDSIQKDYVQRYSQYQCANNCNKEFVSCSCNEDCLRIGNCCSDYVSTCLKIEAKLLFSIQQTIKESSKNKEDKCEIRLTNGNCVQCKYPYFFNYGECASMCNSSDEYLKQLNIGYKNSTLTIPEYTSDKTSYITNYTNRICIKRKKCFISYFNSEDYEYEILPDFKEDGELLNCQVCDNPIGFTHFTYAKLNSQNCSKCIKGYYLLSTYNDKGMEKTNCVENCPYGYAVDFLNNKCTLSETIHIDKQNYKDLQIFSLDTLSTCKTQCGIDKIMNNFNNSQSFCSCHQSCLRKGNCCKDFSYFCKLDFTKSRIKSCEDIIEVKDNLICRQCKVNSFLFNDYCYCNEGYKYNMYLDICEKMYGAYLHSSNSLIIENQALSKLKTESIRSKSNIELLRNQALVKLLTKLDSKYDKVTEYNIKDNNSKYDKILSLEKEMVKKITKKYPKIINSNLIDQLVKQIHAKENSMKLNNLLKYKNNTNIFSDLLKDDELSPYKLVLNGNISINLLAGNENPKIITQNIYNTDSYNSNSSTVNNTNSNNQIDISNFNNKTKTNNPINTLDYNITGNNLPTNKNKVIDVDKANNKIFNLKKRVSSEPKSKVIINDDNESHNLEQYLDNKDRNNTITIQDPQNTRKKVVNETEKDEENSLDNSNFIFDSSKLAKDSESKHSVSLSNISNSTIYIYNHNATQHH